MRELTCKVIIAAIFTVVIWASTFVAIRYIGPYFTPEALNLGREISALIVLLVVWFFSREGLPPKKAWLGICIAGVLWFGMYMFCLNWGERLLDAGTASLLVKIGPIFVALFAGWFLGEKLQYTLFLGMIISILGIAIISFYSSSQGNNTLAGVVLCVIGAILDAVGIVGQKHALRYCSGLQFMTFSILIATIIFLPFAVPLLQQIKAAPPLDTALMLYVGICGTAISYLTWSYALARTSAGKMGAITFAVPPIVILISWLCKLELPGTIPLLGGILCLTGVVISWQKSVKIRKISISEISEFMSKR